MQDKTQMTENDKRKIVTNFFSDVKRYDDVINFNKFYLVLVKKRELGITYEKHEKLAKILSKKTTWLSKSTDLAINDFVSNLCFLFAAFFS